MQLLLGNREKLYKKLLPSNFKKEQLNFQIFLSEFYKDGILSVIYQISNGYYNGNCKAFHKNAKIWEEGKYVNGTAEGEWLVYNEQGKLIRTDIYKNDEVVEEIIH